MNSWLSYCLPEDKSTGFVDLSAIVDLSPLLAIPISFLVPDPALLAIVKVSPKLSSLAILPLVFARDFDHFFVFLKNNPARVSVRVNEDGHLVE